MKRATSGSVTRMIFLPILFLWFVAGCEKDPSYDLLSGDLIGFVGLSDQYMHALEDRSNVAVTLEGSKPLRVAYTDANGKFELKGVQTGIYNLSYAKEGFGTFVNPGYQFVGGSIPGSVQNVSLYELPDVEAGNLALEDASQFWTVNVHATFDISNFSVADDFWFYRYYLSDSPDVSWTKFKETGYTGSDKTENIGFMLQNIGDKFPSGSDLYVVVYPCTEYIKYYVDMETGLFVYTSVNPDNGSDVVHMIVPEAPEESPYN